MSVPDLSGLLNHASRVLATRMTAALAEVGLTPRQQCVLVHARGNDLTQIQLAELVDLDKTTMVVTMDELERAGLAERRPSPTDRRARIVTVTEAGAAMAGRGQAVVDKVHGDVLGSLPAASREVFVAALTGLVNDELAEPVDCDRPVRRPRQSRK